MSGPGAVPLGPSSRTPPPPTPLSAPASLTPAEPPPQCTASPLPWPVLSRALFLYSGSQALPPASLKGQAHPTLMRPPPDAVTTGQPGVWGCGLPGPSRSRSVEVGGGGAVSRVPWRGRRSRQAGVRSLPQVVGARSPEARLSNRRSLYRSGAR